MSKLSSKIYFIFILIFILTSSANSSKITSLVGKDDLVKMQTELTWSARSINDLVTILTENTWSAKSTYPFDHPNGKVDFCKNENRTNFEFYNNLKNFRYKNKKASYEVLSIENNTIKLKMLGERKDGRYLWNIVFVSENKWYWERPDGDNSKWFRYRCD